MRTLRSKLKPLPEEPIVFYGGPLDGWTNAFRPPLRPHIYWHNRSGSYEVYVLVEELGGWRYQHQPDAIVGKRPKFAIEPDDFTP